MYSWITGSAGESLAPSREEIESLCILHAIGVRGCPVSDLGTRLGLSPGLASAVAESVAPLVSAGWVEQDNDRLLRTDEGSRWLSGWLSRISPRGDR